MIKLWLPIKIINSEHALVGKYAKNSGSVSQILKRRHLKRETTHPYGGISISPKMTPCCATYAFETNGNKMNYP